MDCSREYRNSRLERRCQPHTHEYCGCVEIIDERTKYYCKCSCEEEFHNHRFCGVTKETIILPCGNHIHTLSGNTDCYDGHFHTIDTTTGKAVYLEDGRHIHYVNENTTRNDGHIHKFQFVTMIENPIGRLRE